MNKNVETLYQTTPLQHGMLHHSLLDRASGVYVEQFSCVLTGPLDPARFQRAWTAVAHRHDVLRTLFIRLQETQPVQVVRKHIEVPMQRLDWRADPPITQQERFDAFLKQDRARGFNLSEAPLMRLMLAHLGGQRWHLLWTYHHAILDGWSMPVVLADVFRHYEAGRSLPLPPAPVDYRHYVAWLRRQDVSRSLPFWIDTLRGFREPLTFAPSMAPPAPSGRGGAGTRRLATHHGTPGSGWMDAAIQVCRAHRITLNTLCQGAWALLLGRYANRDDVLHGLVVSGRPSELPGAELVAGLFINTLPLRVRLPADQALMPWLREVQSLTQQIEQRAHTPLTEVLGCAEVPRQKALFDTLYVFENYPGQAAFGAVTRSLGLGIEDVRAVEETNYALALIVVPGEELGLHVTYDTARFSDAAVERLAARYLALLDEMVERPESPLAELRLDETPQPVLPAGLNAEAVPTLVDLMARHASEAAQAFVAGGRALNHAGLRARVTAMLAQWRLMGWQPGERAVLSADTDEDAIVLLLSGLAHGVDCVVLDTGVSLEDLVEAGGQTLPDGTPLRAMDARAPTHAAVPSGAALPVHRPALGACSLLSRDASGRWVQLRYGHAQLAWAVNWFIQSCPPSQATHVPVRGRALEGQNLWTTLMVLGAGMTLHGIEAGTLPEFLQEVTRRDLSWHCIRLDGASTRELGRVSAPAGLRVAHWSVDARSLTASSARMLHTAAPSAAVLREWRWPAQSLPHAISAGRGVAAIDDSEGEGVGLASTHTALSVVDHGQRPVALDAQGHLAVAGASVAARWRAGDDATQAGTTMLPAWTPTPIGAWVTAEGCHARLLHTSAAQETANPRLRALEPQLAARPGVRDLALIETLSAHREWQVSVFCQLHDEAQGPEVLADLAAYCSGLGLADPIVHQVQTLPRQAWGIDRQALLRGDAVSVRPGGLTTPRDDLEAGLHAIWCDLLKREHIGIDENYFELGGQSLLAAVMLFQIDEQLSVQVDMEALVSAPTIAQLAHLIRSGGVAAGAPVDLAGKAVLAADIQIAAGAPERALDNVFLTGATGFLGVHLLADLLDSTSARVHCLVRAADAPAGLDRLVSALRAHGLWCPAHEGRILAVPGELDKPLLGLSEAAFDALARDVDVIYHNGAMVNFVYPYRMLEQTNVRATEDILRLACRHRTKPVHYISTVGVLDRTAPELAEQLSVPLHPHLNSGYEQSKWVAEQLLSQAADRGVPVTIYRPSRIVGHSVSGRLNLDDLFCRVIKGMVLLGKAPRDTGFDNMLPVDVASRIIVEASLNPRARGRAVHVINPQWHSMDALVDFIESRGYPLERLDYQQWLDQLTAHVKRHTDHPLAMLIPVLRVLNPMADPTVGQRLPIAHQNMSDWAVRALAEGLRPMQTWLTTYVDHLQDIGYLPKAPAA